MNDVPTPGDALNQFLAERQMPLLNPDLTSRFNNIVSPDVTLAAVGLAERWLAHATTQIKGAARTRERTAAGFYDKNIYLDGYSEPASLDEATPEQMRRLVAHKRSVKLHEAASMEDMGLKKMAEAYLLVSVTRSGADPAPARAAIRQLRDRIVDAYSEFRVAVDRSAVEHAKAEMDE